MLITMIYSIRLSRKPKHIAIEMLIESLLFDMTKWLLKAETEKNGKMEGKHSQEKIKLRNSVDENYHS